MTPQRASTELAALELEALEIELEAAEQQAGMRIAVEEDEADEEEVEVDYASVTIDELATLGDVDALLTLGQALRTGTLGRERDLDGCLRCYEHAAELESAEGMFRLALFYLSGVGVPEDDAQATTLLRDAARLGHLRAKVYLGNLYELGVGRERAPDKADVWYRGVARALALEHEEDEPEYALALAELGCIRYVRELLKDESIPKEERLTYLHAAKGLGFSLMQRNRKRDAAERKSIELEVAAAMKLADDAGEADATTGAAKAGDAKTGDTKAGDTKTGDTKTGDTKIGDPKKGEKATSSAAKAEPAKKTRPKPPGPSIGERLRAFFITMFFMAIAVTASRALTELAEAKVAAGEVLPVIGTQVAYITPIMVILVMLPALLVYRARTLLLCLVGAGALAYGGAVLWATEGGTLFQDRLFQAEIFGFVGLVVALFAFALAGMIRFKPKRPLPR